MAKKITITQGYYVLVDDEDYELLHKSNWCLVSGGGYASRRRNNKIELMHRVIMGLEIGDKRVIDHINGNGLDNRKSNLRICTQSQNCKHSRKKKTSTSKYKGLYKCKRSGAYVARIRNNYKVTLIGRFRSEIDAALAYDKKAIELHGEFADLNFPITKKQDWRSFKM